MCIQVIGDRREREKRKIEMGREEKAWSGMVRRRSVNRFEPCFGSLPLGSHDVLDVAFVPGTGLWFGEGIGWMGVPIHVFEANDLCLHLLNKVAQTTHEMTDLVMVTGEGLS